MGFAVGVGKTYDMLQEANRRRERGEDVVVGWVERQGRAGTEAEMGDLVVVPALRLEYRGSTFEEMDVEAVLARHPRVVVVDELAHSNVPGSPREKRWQDVQVLLEAGIDVLSTLNVQHLDSLNDIVHDITGIVVRETVPDTLLAHADEVQMVDLSPQALLARLERGDIYPADQIQQARAHWFNLGNLNALRELALREVAHEVDEDTTEYQKRRRPRTTWATHDRIMVCITPTAGSQRLIRRGWRIARRLRADLVCVYVEDHAPTDSEQAILRHDFDQANRLDIPVVTLHGTVRKELARYARENRITQIVLGHSLRSRWEEWTSGGSIIHHLVSQLKTIDILVVAHEKQPGEGDP
jgi:two-component system sensor histidine kinase KdpD